MWAEGRFPRQTRFHLMFLLVRQKSTKTSRLIFCLTLAVNSLESGVVMFGILATSVHAAS